MKQLTIAIPAYNAEAYLRKCLESMSGLDGRLEIIVINDGSTDGTEAIAKEFAERSNDIRLISKPNGGHGSAINTAIRNANGRYFKVIDADDWIVSENLKPLLDTLERTEVDAVITGYHTVDMKNGKVRAYSSECKYTGQEIGLNELSEVYESIPSCFSFHGLCYRTEMYRDSGLQLSEGIFYEDQEYAILPFAHIDSVFISPLYFYEYLIGRADQSVSFASQVRNLDHIERVITRILDERAMLQPLPDTVDQYFLKKLAVVVVSYYAVALVKNPDKKAGRADAQRFERILQEREPVLLEMTAKKRRTLRIMNRLHLSPRLYQWLHDTPMYGWFKRIWVN